MSPRDRDSTKDRERDSTQYRGRHTERGSTNHEIGVAVRDNYIHESQTDYQRPTPAFLKIL